VTALALALAMASAQPLGTWAPSPSVSGPSWLGGRVLTTSAIHVGVRPAFFADDEGAAPHRLELGAGVTLQVSWAGAL